MTLLILLALALLLLLAVIAVVTVRFSSTRDAEGKLSAPGCLSGCAVALVLSVLGALGLAVFTGAAVLLATPTEEFRTDLREAAREVGEGLRELGRELRENADDMRRDLREEVESARRARRESESAPQTAPIAPTAPDQPGADASSSPWRARVVVSWPGASDPHPELLAALAREALEEPVDVAVQQTNDETDGLHTRATLSARSRAANVKELEALLRAQLPLLGEQLGLELTLESVVDDELR